MEGDEKLEKSMRKCLSILIVSLGLHCLCFGETNSRIFLYGEIHGVKQIYESELEIWQDYYINQNMRHLFVEFGYGTTKLLNQWMQEDDDAILLQIYDNWEGTTGHNEYNLEFLKNIKRTCPETIFHGTDVGHQYETTDSIWLRQLEEKGLTETEEYTIGMENIQQAKDYYKTNKDAFRENCMAANFIREFNSLPENEKIMGIYGNAHVSAQKDISGKVPSMTNQIRKNYKNNKNLVETYDLSDLSLLMEPLAIEEFTIKGKTYRASYFGEQDLTGFKNYKSRKFWRIENPENDLKKTKHTGDYLPYDNYPTKVKLGDIFRIEYTMIDDTKTVTFYRADGKTYNGYISTNRINLE